MIDQEIIEQFVRAKVLLQEKLIETGSIPGGPEIESQIMFVETRMDARVKQDILHGTEELYALKHILNEMVKGG